MNLVSERFTIYIYVQWIVDKESVADDRKLDQLFTHYFVRILMGK